MTPVGSYVFFKFLRGKLARGCQEMYPFAHARRLTAVLAGPDLLSMCRVFVSYSQPIRFARFDGKSVNRGLPVLDKARALDPCRRSEGSGLWGREWRAPEAPGASISRMRRRCRLKLRSEPDNQNSVISFVISKWMLPELSFPDRWSRGTKLWERDWVLSDFESLLLP